MLCGGSEILTMFWWCAGLTALACAARAFLYEPYQVEITRYQLEIDDLPDSFQGFTILQLSDLHISGLGSRERRLMEIIAREEVDLILNTGDLISSPRGIPVALQVIRGARSRYGTFFVYGNNEIEELRDLSDIRRPLEELGYQVLVNENRTLNLPHGTVHVIGVDDPKSYRDDLELAVTGLPESGLKILMSHTPETFEKACALGIPITFAGHTHGGQVRFPIIGAIWTDTPRTGIRYSAGRYLRDSRHLIVSRGLGWSLMPMRFLCLPEIVFVTLLKSPPGTSSGSDHRSTFEPERPPLRVSEPESSTSP